MKKKDGFEKNYTFLIHPLENSKTCLININQDELTNLVNKLQQKTKGGKQVMVINLQTNENTIYPSIRSYARALNVSQTPIKHEAIINSIYKKKTKLYLFFIIFLPLPLQGTGRELLLFYSYLLL